ncbi:MAG: divalent-cation tolerance protein CutA [Sphingomonadales bacterium]|jgi:periplasmic divalent cation tolerance protein
MQTDYATLFVTCGTSDEARHIGKMLVHENLAACANVLGAASSIYKWEGRMMEESEVLLFLKTQTSLIEQASKRITEMHSYDTPCIVAWPIIGGNQNYLNWIGEVTGV